MNITIPAANTERRSMAPLGIGRSGTFFLVDLGIEGIVQIHAGNVEQRQGDQ